MFSTSHIRGSIFGFTKTTQKEEDKTNLNIIIPEIRKLKVLLVLFSSREWLKFIAFLLISYHPMIYCHLALYLEEALQELIWQQIKTSYMRQGRRDTNNIWGP